MIRDPELLELDEQLSVLGQAEVEPPPWSAVVDRIAVAPQPAGRRLSVGWSAVLAGAAVALAVAIGGAVSEPVRETVFEPVANLLPWVDDGPDEPTPGEQVPIVDERPTDDRGGVTDRPPATEAPARTTTVRSCPSSG